MCTVLSYHTALTTGSDFVEKSALELLSAATVDKVCREAVAQHCKSWLDRLSQQKRGSISAQATLILAKIGQSADGELTARFSALLLDDSQNQIFAIEGLAYTSLQPAVKEKIVKDEILLKSILTALRQETKLSPLTVLNNLTTYRLPRSEEQKRVAQLKAYANAAKSQPDDPLDNDGVVTIRCRRLLDAGIVSELVTSLKGTTSTTSLSMIANILCSLAKEQKHRIKMVQEGAIGALLHIHQRLCRVEKDGPRLSATSSHALARILISTNPTYVFSASVPVTSAVSAIVQLLRPDADQEERNLLPVFEGLLALTNLASMEDNTARELIIRQAWPVLEEQLLLSSNTLVQRASVELICNLMLSPTGVSKFADGGKQARTRMHILLALSDVEDLATRKAAGGALAMLTEWDTAVSAILAIERGVKILLTMCLDENDEVRHRGMVCVLNSVTIQGDVGVQAKAKVKAENGIEQLRQAVLTTKHASVLSMGAEIIKQLT